LTLFSFPLTEAAASGKKIFQSFILISELYVETISKKHA